MCIFFILYTFLFSTLLMNHFADSTQFAASIQFHDSIQFDDSIIFAMRRARMRAVDVRRVPPSNISFRFAEVFWIVELNCFVELN